MAAMMVRSALERAMAFVRQQTLFRSAAPALALAGAAPAAAASSAASNPLLDALWLAAPKSKVSRRFMAPGGRRACWHGCHWTLVGVLVKGRCATPVGGARGASGVREGGEANGCLLCCA